MAKLYFDESSESCYTIKTHLLNMENEDIPFVELSLKNQLQWIKDYVYNNTDENNYKLFLKEQLNIDFLENIKESVVDNMKKNISWILERLDKKF